MLFLFDLESFQKHLLRHNLQWHHNACQYMVTTAADRKTIYCHFESEHKCKSSFLIFVIGRLFVQVGETYLHLKVGRSRLRRKLNGIKSQV